MKATGSRDPEEPRAFTDDDSHDESFRKQQEVSVVESTPPNHGGEKKNVVLQLFKNDEYASYDTEKKKKGKTRLHQSVQMIPRTRTVKRGKSALAT